MLGGGCKAVAAVAAFLSLPAGARGAADARWVEPATGIEFVRISGGEFAMGSGSGADDERPAHPVRVRTFYLGRWSSLSLAWTKGENPSALSRLSIVPNR